MRLRTVVYAEGGGELGPSAARPGAPGEPIPAHELGSAHALLAIALRYAHPGQAVEPEFERPQRLRSRVPRGSDLLVGRIVQQLTSWPSAEQAPHLAVVFVDEDGDAGRRRELKQALEQNAPTPIRVFAVARQEFEAWLVTDVGALGRALGFAVSQLPDPEHMKPGEAKERLVDLLSKAGNGKDLRSLRVAIAASADAQQLEKRSRSFRLFVEDLRDARLRELVTPP